jgi:dTDP-4-amino-4,6-dideoxygalactose transaminase
LKSYLEENGIEVKIHYPIPLHLQNAAKGLGWPIGSLPVSEKQAGELLTLPIHQFINDHQIYYMVEMIKIFYGKK